MSWFPDEEWLRSDEEMTMSDLTDKELDAAETLLATMERANERVAVDPNWMHTAKLLNRMATEIRRLRKRCLCRGAFRCTPCLEEMEADAAAAAEAEEKPAPAARRPVLYVAHPLTPTDAEIRAIGVPSDGATEYTLREHAVRENLARAQRWLTWLRVAFQETTFTAPWLSNILAYGDDAYIAAFERGGVDACAVAERCDGIVLCGGRISDGMRREMEHCWSRPAGVGLLGNRARVWDLTCEKSPEPPEKMRPHRPFASWAIVYERKEPSVLDRRDPAP